MRIRRWTKEMYVCERCKSEYHNKIDAVRCEEEDEMTIIRLGGKVLPIEHKEDDFSEESKCN